MKTLVRLILSSFLFIASSLFAMSDCRCLLGEWTVPGDNIKNWYWQESPHVVIFDVEPVPGTHGIYNLSGCIDGNILVDSKCIEQYGHVQTVSLITKELFLRSDAPNPLTFCGFFRNCYIPPCPPRFFGLI